MSDAGMHPPGNGIGRKLWFAPLLVLWLGACSRAPVDPLERATRAISAQRIQEIGKLLSADAMAGRYYASPEADSAASYLVGQLRRLGLPPVQRAENVLASHPATYVHHFSVTLYHLGANVRLSVVRGGRERPALLGEEFLPLVFAREGEVRGRVTRLRGRLEDLRHTRAPVRDRIVLVESQDALDRSGTPVETLLHRAATQLQNMGAAAVLFAGESDILHSAATTFPTQLPPALAALTRSTRGTLLNLNADRLSLAGQAQAWQQAEMRSIPALVVRSSWAGRLQPEDEVLLRVDLVPEVSLGQNVLVGFRGALRPQELVVLGAHYDASGINAAGDILNGADDNCSGVAALLEVAAALAEVRGRLGRSVLLAFLSAEAAGQSGSQSLLQDLPRLLGDEVRPVAMLSLHAVGRNGNRPLLVVGGSTHAMLGAVLERYDRREVLLGAPLALHHLPQPRRDLGSLDLAPRRDSDELAFRHAGIPSLLLNDGLDPELYGQPGDDWKDVDADKVARVARLAFRTAFDLATDLRPAALPALARPQ